MSNDDKLNENNNENVSQNQVSNAQMLEREQRVYDMLDELGVKYNVIEHNPLYTADDLICLKDPSQESYCRGNHCKNLFLRNAKGNKYYLIVVKDDRQVNLKELKNRIGSTNLSFASPERLYKVLGLLPGSVNPFSLVNDESHGVELYIDSEVLNGENMNFHPNINTKTVNLTLDGFKEFLNSLENSIEIIDFDF